MNWKRLLRLSRPRFWFYLFGPFLLGVSGAGILQTWSTKTLLEQIVIVLMGGFFLFPANLFVYGVNDVFDYETDRHNPKKRGYEDLLLPTEQLSFVRRLSSILSPLLILLFVMSPLTAVLVALFLFMGYGYSAPPIRAKARPFIDTIFNGLYVVPGLVGFSLVADRLPSLFVIFAALAWCMAMHAYSAIPDQEADYEAKIETIATVLGTRGTLLWCAVLMTLSTILVTLRFGPIVFILLAPYLLLFVKSISAKKPTDVSRWYRWFPWVNMAVGFVLFLFVVRS
jgi:4-hydroxybenzoate polyprenyltransferase